MLQFCRLAIRDTVLHKFHRNCALLSKMSLPESLKRKVEGEDEESLTKKVKGAKEGDLDKTIENAVKSSNRVRKPKKVVLLLSYLGKEYFGMQKNSNVSTVEEELFKALLKADVILQEECDFPKTMKFQRAARTDKGVSAVRQIVSMKIPLNEISNSLPEKVNQHLPADIRVIAVKRVTQSFDAKIACDARTYSYMLPTFAFSADLENDERYSITAERIEEVNKFLHNYVGTHNFYNFTSGRLPGDPSCNRYIMSCKCEPPFKSHGLEFVVIKIKGQSFMLHQIRKMVGLAIAFMRNLADENVLKKTWLTERIDIPKAPGLGLMLEELHYDWYNTKYGSDGMHDALLWDEYNEIVEKFKSEKICSNISETEKEEKSMMQWLETLPYHSYDVRDAGPPTMLPAKETTKEGENGSNETEKSESSADIKSESEVNTNSPVNINLSNIESDTVKGNEIKCES